MLWVSAHMFHYRQVSREATTCVQPYRYLLSQHPEVEAKLVAELEHHGLLASPVCPKPHALVYADLKELVYLQAIIKVAT